MKAFWIALLCLVIVVLVTIAGAAGITTITYTRNLEDVSGWVKFCLAFAGCYTVYQVVVALVKAVYGFGKKIGESKK